MAEVSLPLLVSSANAKEKMPLLAGKNIANLYLKIIVRKRKEMLRLVWSAKIGFASI